MLRRAAALLSFLILLPAATATHGPAGEVLDLASVDVAVQLQTFTSARICFIDADANGGFGIGEPALITTTGSCTGNSRPSDLRIVTWNGHPAGARLGTAPDANKPMAGPSPEANIGFVDQDGNGVMSAGDAVYANLVNPSSSFVDAGDVRLAPFGALAAGTQVNGGDADLSFGLTVVGNPGDSIGLADLDNDGLFTFNDLLYVNGDRGGAELAEPGDLRLVGTGNATGFGTFAAPGDPDADSFYDQIDRPPCFHDVDASGAYSPGDKLFLDIDGTCTGSVSVGDIRLTASGAQRAGTIVATGAPELGESYAAVTAARASYIDSDGDGRLDLGETVFIDLVEPTANRVDAGDLRVSPTGTGAGGVPAAAGDGEAGRALRQIGDFRNVVSRPQGHRVGDLLFLNVDVGAAEGVEGGDVRLVEHDDLPFGGRATPGTGEVVTRVLRLGAAVCGTSSGYQLGDALYLAVGSGCPSSVQVGAIRLTAVGGNPAGSLVVATDPDSGAPLVTSTATEWRYVERDSASGWSGGDTLYVDAVATGSARVDVGDIRITTHDGLPAMSVVTAGSGDVSLTLTTLGAVSGRTVFVDGDGDNVFGVNDLAYVDADGTGEYAGPLDVRLLPLPEPDKVQAGPSPSPSPTDDASPSPSVSPTTSPTVEPTPSQTVGSESPSPTDEERPRTPGPALALVLVAVVAVAVLLRRR